MAGRLPWFRLYHEARTDRKLAALTDRQHRVWFNLMCLASEQQERGRIAPMGDYLLALEVADGDEEVLNATLCLLVKLHIVSVDDTGVLFINFARRQYDHPSDAPSAAAQRQANKRARDRAANGHEPEPPPLASPHITSESRDITSESRPVTAHHAVEEIRGDKKRVEEREAVVHTQASPARERVRVREAPPPTPLRAVPKPARAAPVYAPGFLAYMARFTPGAFGSIENAHAAYLEVEPPDDALLAGLERWIGCDRWERGYHNNGETFIRDRLWEQSPPPAQRRSDAPTPARPTTRDTILGGIDRAEARMLGRAATATAGARHADHDDLPGSIPITAYHVVPSRSV